MKSEMQSLYIGLEFGSTRIKAVAIDRAYSPEASGEYTWKSSYENGVWTYPLEEVWTGLRSALAPLAGLRAEAMGVSGMMHGYLAFDRDWNLLVPFRTWQNTMTGPAAAELSALFGFNIPQRWSIAHLYQAVLNREEHVPRIAHITTLAGYVHFMLTGVNAVGVGEASGMFPIDSTALDYDGGMLHQFEALTAHQPWSIRDLLPRVLPAGAEAGRLTEEGARLLGGLLPPGIPLCPPEGDAGTGMTATNSVRPRTGNVSAGTSDFAMIVTERPLGVHREIDMVTTPAGAPVAMVHCNNCTSDLNAWVGLFFQLAGALGAPVGKDELYTLLFRQALEGEADCGGLLNYNYFSGEGVTDLDAGRPVFTRSPDAGLTLSNFMRAQLLSALATLKIGLDILTEEEKIPIDKLYGHGGFFKTPEVGQTLLSAAVNAPVSVMETAGEGGPYGMALLAAYMLQRDAGESLEDFLDSRVFRDAVSVTRMARPEDVAGFETFLERYKRALVLERTAVEVV